LLDLPSVKWTPMVAQFQKIAICRLVHAGAKILFPINSSVEICFLDIPRRRHFLCPKFNLS
jgi:hypothetical protein